MIFYHKKLYFIIKYLFFLWTILILSRCGYQLSTNTVYTVEQFNKSIPMEIILYSYDSFNTLTRTVKNELILNKIIVSDNLQDINPIYQTKKIPYLNITNTSKQYLINSILSDGGIFEYQIILEVQTLFYIPHKNDYYPVNINTHRTFIYDSTLGLSNLTQENEMINDMYQEIAQQLTQKFLVALYN